MELLVRWSVDGVGKVGGTSPDSFELPTKDPAWAMPIKDLVRYRAKEQQARAVAAVIDARETDM